MLSSRSSAIRSAIDALKRELECPICLSILHDPVSLRCNHFFCAFCIDKTLAQSAEVPCPLCKVPYTRRIPTRDPMVHKLVVQFKEYYVSVEQEFGLEKLSQEVEKVVPEHLKFQPLKSNIPKDIVKRYSFEYGKREESVKEEEQEEEEEEENETRNVNLISDDGYRINLWTDYYRIDPGKQVPSDSCAICLGSDGEEGDELVFCDNCDLCVHQTCYGIEFLPDGNWFCEPCSEKIEKVVCCVCPNTQDMAFKKTTDGQWIHVNCALWIPEPEFFGDSMNSPVRDVSLIDPRRFSLNCNICKKRSGACVQCSVPSCISSFHVTCGIRSGLRFEIREKDSSEKAFFHQFCRKHITSAASLESQNSLGSDFLKDQKRRLSNSDHSDERSSKISRNSRIVLLPTKLDSSQRDYLDQFCKVFGAVQKSAFTKGVTHIVCNCNSSDGGNLKTRTTKLLFGLSTGKWVMCFDWIKASLASGHILSEESFEVKSDTVGELLPRSSRLSSSHKLFEGTFFILEKKFISQAIYDDLMELILLEGGGVYRSIDEADLDSIPKEQMVIVKENTDRSYEAHVKIQHPSWIFDCISTMKLI